MALKFFLVCGIALALAAPARSQSTGGIRGSVLDASGATVVGANVTVTNITSGGSVRTTTAPDGGFQVEGLAAQPYQVTIEKTGFQTFVQQITLTSGQPVVMQVQLSVQTKVQTVEVHATAAGATLQPSQQEILKSNQTLRVLSREQMDAAGPLAGAQQIVAQAPGANVVSYGNTGGTKATLMLNGINQGWGGYGGYNYPGSLGVTLDGIPLPDAATGLWASASLPQTDMFQNVNVTYGPGDPVDRYYTNVGGSFDFVPMEPTSKMHMDGTLSFGSYNQKNLELNMSTGEFRGWSTSLSGGLGKGDSFRQAADGFSNPDKDGALFAKTTKSFAEGSFSLGGYYARSGGYRAQIIPTSDVPTLTVAGLGAVGAQDYSQPTSGFYSTLPYSSYNKYDINELGVVYARETFLLDPTIVIQNTSWFTHEFRFHERNNDVYVTGQQLQEWNDPHHNTVGDRFVMTKTLPFNKVSLGGYFLHDLYNSRNNFFNTADGGSGPGHIVNIGGKVRSSYFDQDNYVAFLQDDITPLAWLHITPGVRFDRFHTGYTSGTLQDFTFAPGVVLSAHCPLTGFVDTNPAINTTDQAANCGANESRTAIEPSINAAVEPRQWLTLYGGYTRTFRSPSLGGGGGLFQSLNPDTNYTLASADYYQAGFKVHKSQMGRASNVLFGAAYYHLTYANEQLGVELGNGNFINTSGSSHYDGVNAYFDVDPLSKLHVYTNLNGESATYDQFYSGSQSFQGLPVSYVPAATWNTGAYYTFTLHESVGIEPRVWFQFVGSQHIFDNCGLVKGACTTALPSKQTMPSYETINLSFRVPYRRLSFNLDMLNLLGNQYNVFEYVSSGGYYGTSTGGYTFAYPGAPFTIYGSIKFRF